MTKLLPTIRTKTVI